MKHKILLFALAFCLLFSSCGILNEKFNALGFDVTGYNIIEEKDSHGGFHGDGTYYLILDCSSNPQKARNMVGDWTPLPLSENLNLVMYGGEKDGTYYEFNFAEKSHFPVIENGVYKFYDRHSEVIDPFDDSLILNRYSYNFSLAMYDFDNNIFYYFELDT
ncbi:MAG: hypothetical protein K6F76_05720 [Clostridiales bacterium]|nr:hypothetical protein [Clostridiales bacterium]